MILFFWQKLACICNNHLFYKISFLNLSNMSKKMYCNGNYKNKLQVLMEHIHSKRRIRQFGNLRRIWITHTLIGQGELYPQVLFQKMFFRFCTATILKWILKNIFFKELGIIFKNKKGGSSWPCPTDLRK